MTIHDKPPTTKTMRTPHVIIVCDGSFNRLVFGILACLILWSGCPTAVSAVTAPNGQYGQCGPYYLWYQVGPESALYGGDYVELCEITFDVSQVYTAFDFVYFTDTPTFRRSALDQNHDGISDLYYQLPPKVPKLTQALQAEDIREQEQQTNQWNPTLLRWKPAHGCVKINLRDCWGATFQEQCGAMISLQPRPGQSSGQVDIPVHVTKLCPPYGASCDETAQITHTYSNCTIPPSRDFVLNKQVDNVLQTTYGNLTFNFTLTVLNASQKKADTLLTDTFTDGTLGGQLDISKIDIACPTTARCTITRMTDHQFQFEIISLGVDELAKITYVMTGNSYEIPNDDVSFFTNKALLSNGTLSELTVGIRGRGNFARRPERPKPTPGQHPSERQN